MTTPKIVPNLWFDHNAEEAVNFYAGIFPHVEIGRKAYFGKEGKEIHGMDEGTVMTIEFTLNGQDFLALNGGPVFKFNEAVSFIIYCDTQQEIDYYWSKLGEGGDEKAQQCGWLKDKFGLSWQITPPQLDDMLLDEDRERADRVMKVMLQMKKLDIAKLEEAYNEGIAA